MERPGFDVVTGAFGYIGSHVARELLDRGRRVHTFSRREGVGHPLHGRVRVEPQRFDDEGFLRERLRGCDVLYNTYWIRFPRGGATYEQAVERSGRLFAAARAAGARRVVHVSVTNCREDSPLPYYAGKARVEALLRAAAPSHAVVRPTLVFGPGDILLNNIAWLLRRWPFFPLAGRGDYRLQPVFVDDLAQMLADAGAREGDETFDAAGPDTLGFEALLRLLCEKLGRRPRLRHWPPTLALLGCRVLGWFVRDVILTRPELRGLMDEMLVSHEPPRGRTRLAAWLDGAAASLGTSYASELDRHFRGAALQAMERPPSTGRV
jgi:NADH dehydrogenase